MSAGQERDGDLSHDCCGVFASGGWVFRHPEGGLREDKRKGERRVTPPHSITGQDRSPLAWRPTKDGQTFYEWSWQPERRVRVRRNRRLSERRKGE